MPLQTSRYLTMFSLVIVCICGFTLLDQFAGLTKRTDATLEPRPQSVRITRTLQPGPPAEPQWVQPPAEDFAAYDYEYPSGGYGQATDLPVQAASFSNQKPQVSFEPIAQPTQNQAFDVWEDEPQVNPTPPPAPAEELSFDDFADQEPVQPQLPAPAEPRFDEPPADAWGDDSNLGSPTDKPWGDPGPQPPVSSSGPVAVVPVDQPSGPQLPEVESEISVRDTVDVSGGTVVVGFVGPSSPSQPQVAEKPKPKAVDGSYRIRSLTPPQRTPKRLRGTFRFSAPAVEQPSTVRPNTAVTQTAAVVPSRPACRHHRTAGQRVCPKCGVIHSK